jgi:hypothetical protein
LLGITARTIYRKLEQRRGAAGAGAGDAPEQAPNAPPHAGSPQSDPHLDGSFAAWLANPDADPNDGPRRLDSGAHA